MVDGPQEQERLGANEQAWQVLGTVNDWLRHSEAKTAAVLAGTGVASGVLFHLAVTRPPRSDGALDAVLSACAVLLALTAVLSLWSIVPRLRPHKSKDDAPTNLLYFSHITQRFHAPTGADDYAQALQSLLADPEEMTRQIAVQIHANAGIARRKFRLMELAVSGLALALVALGLAAFRVATT